MHLLFLNFRSDKLEASKFEFDRNIMDVYKGNLVADQVALDDTTFENLRHRYELQRYSLMVHFHCPTPIPIPIIVPIPIVCRSAPLGPIPMVIPMQITDTSLVYLKN